MRIPSPTHPSTPPHVTDPAADPAPAAETATAPAAGAGRAATRWHRRPPSPTTRLARSTDTAAPPIAEHLTALLAAVEAALPTNAHPTTGQPFAGPTTVASDHGGPGRAADEAHAGLVAALDLADRAGIRLPWTAPLRELADHLAVVVATAGEMTGGPGLAAAELALETARAAVVTDDPRFPTVAAELARTARLHVEATDHPDQLASILAATTTTLALRGALPAHLRPALWQRSDVVLLAELDPARSPADVGARVLGLPEGALVASRRRGCWTLPARGAAPADRLLVRVDPQHLGPLRAALGVAGAAPASCHRR